MFPLPSAICPFMPPFPRTPSRLPCVVVHGLGAALAPAVELALHLDRMAPGHYTLAVRTGTVHLFDDVNPLNEVRPVLHVHAS